MGRRNEVVIINRYCNRMKTTLISWPYRLKVNDLGAGRLGSK